jgi:chemotaxis protein MotB
MARKKHDEEHENHERWLVSYADFITLLFAFFVVMYSISSVNEGKYRVLSDSITQAFRNIPINAAGMNIDASPTAIVHPLNTQRRVTLMEAQRKKSRERFRQMSDSLRKALAPLEKDGQVNINQGAFGIAIDISAGALFPSGEAALGTEAQNILGTVGEVLSYSEFPITVEGHTDNVPIAGARYPSNWELSAARASAVVRLFVDAGVLATRLTAAGYADQRPVADNDSDAGRMRNRRVRIQIEAPDPERVIDPAAAPAEATPVQDVPGQFSGSFPKP